MKLKLLFLTLLSGMPLSFASPHPEVSVNIPWTGIVRTTALESLDKILALAFDYNSRSYKLMNPNKEESVLNSVQEIIEFAKNFSYFSSTRPLVGQVTSEQEDIDLTQKILLEIHSADLPSRDRMIATAEILTKVLAYRDLKMGSEIAIPSVDKRGNSLLMTYKIDTIIDLWYGMPAFGLLPKDQGKSAPILLFRGTDLSLGTARSWASVISDLNTSGPGLSTFEKAQDLIHTWLVKAAKSGQKTRVMGYSLGGVLSFYTLVYETDFINTNSHFPSVVFNSPGVSKSVLDKWLALAKASNFISFVNRGDLVSKIGLLYGDVFELSTEQPLMPISAHVILMSGQSGYRLSRINVEQENLSR